MTETEAARRLRETDPLWLSMNNDAFDSPDVARFIAGLRELSHWDLLRLEEAIVEERDARGGPVKDYRKTLPSVGIARDRMRKPPWAPPAADSWEPRAARVDDLWFPLNPPRSAWRLADGQKGGDDAA